MRMRREGDEWDWGAWCEVHKESVKKNVKKMFPGRPSNRAERGGKNQHMES